MTNKSLQRIVNEMVDIVVAEKKLRPGLPVKGGQQDIAQSIVGMALVDSRDAILSIALGRPYKYILPTPGLALVGELDVPAKAVEKDSGKGLIHPGESHNDAEKRLHKPLDGNGKPLSVAKPAKPTKPTVINDFEEDVTVEETEPAFV